MTKALSLTLLSGVYLLVECRELNVEGEGKKSRVRVKVEGESKKSRVRVKSRG